jgi:hypothetical protein
VASGTTAADDAMRDAVAAYNIDYQLTPSITGQSANLFPFACSGLWTGQATSAFADPLRSLGAGSRTKAVRMQRAWQLLKEALVGLAG